jgi:uncharacterized protein with HEPN domain
MFWSTSCPAMCLASALPLSDGSSLSYSTLVQVIGEAARRVSRELHDEHPEIPWQNIAGIRHEVVHGYLGVDDDIVWQVVTVRT